VSYSFVVTNYRGRTLDNPLFVSIVLSNPVSEGWRSEQPHLATNPTKVNNKLNIFSGKNIPPTVHPGHGKVVIDDGNKVEA